MSGQLAKIAAGALCPVLRHVTRLRPGPPHWTVWCFHETPRSCVRTFRQQVHCLKAHYRLVSFETGMRALSFESLDGPLATITFDDAYRDNLEIAAEVLLEEAVPATVFATADLCRSGTVRRPDGEFEIMTVDALREWQALGFDVGAHGRAHRDLTTGSLAEASDDIASCKAELEDWLGHEVAHFAFPCGRWSLALVEAVRAIGFRSASTLGARVMFAGASPWPIGRFGGRATESVKTLELRILRARLAAARNGTGRS